MQRTSDDLTPVRRYVTLDRGRTSVSLEQHWWTRLDAIARATGVPANALVCELHRRLSVCPGRVPLAAALRIFCNTARRRFGADPFETTPFPPLPLPPPRRTVRNVQRQAA
jgi:predicted DNA-binding ribbon-helix-helix protein